MDYTAPEQKCHHPEDWTCRWGTRWLKIRSANDRDIALLERFVSRGPSVLGSTQKGIPYQLAKSHPLRSSLQLVEPQRIEWLAERFDEASALAAKADFTVGGQRYWLTVTDPEWRQRILALGEGRYSTRDLGVASNNDRLLLTISLSEPYAPDGGSKQCWKLIAGVVLLPRLARSNPLL